MSQRHVSPEEVLERLEQLEDQQDDHGEQLSEHARDRALIRQEITGLKERIGELEQENEALRARLRETTSGSQPEKKTVAKEIARNELLRQLEEGVERDHRSGEVREKETASVDVPTVQEQAKGRNRELKYNTARTGLEELAEQWRCFEFREGSGTPTGENNRVVKLESVDVPERLWQLYREDEEVESGTTDSVVSTSRRGGQ